MVVEGVDDGWVQRRVVGVPVGLRERCPSAAEGMPVGRAWARDKDGEGLARFGVAAKNADTDLKISLASLCTAALPQHTRCTGQH